METTNNTRAETTIAPRRRGKGTPAAKSKGGKRPYSMFDDSFFDDSTCSSTNADSSSDDSSTNDNDTTTDSCAISPGTASTAPTIRIDSSQLQTQQSFGISESQQSPMLAETRRFHAEPSSTTTENAESLLNTLKSVSSIASHSTNEFVQPISTPLSKPKVLPAIPADEGSAVGKVSPKQRGRKISLSPSTNPNQIVAKVTKETKSVLTECSIAINAAIDLTIDDTPEKKSDVSETNGSKIISIKNSIESNEISDATGCSEALISGFDTILVAHQYRDDVKSSDRVVEKKSKAKKVVNQQQQKQSDKAAMLPSADAKKVDIAICHTPSKRKMDTSTGIIEEDMVVTKDKQVSTRKKPDTQTTSDGGSNVKVPSQKKKKISFQDKVVSHMITSFKPFLLKPLAQTFQTSETTLEFLMLTLVDKNLVTKKEFTTAKGGRTKVLYWANYDGKSKECAAALPATETEQNAAIIELEQTRKELLSINNILANLLNGPSNSELVNQLQKKEDEVLAMKNSLRMMKERIAGASRQQGPLSNKSNVSNRAASLAMCPVRLKVRINALRKEWKNRKEKCMDFVDQLADGMEKKPKDVINSLDIETDEMCKVVLPPIYQIDEMKKI